MSVGQNWDIIHVRWSVPTLLFYCTRDIINVPSLKKPYKIKVFAVSFLSLQSVFTFNGHLYCPLQVF